VGLTEGIQVIFGDSEIRLKKNSKGGRFGVVSPEILLYYKVAGAVPVSDFGGEILSGYCAGTLFLGGFCYIQLGSS
jgi:hypothetical protein